MILRFQIVLSERNLEFCWVQGEPQANISLDAVPCRRISAKERTVLSPLKSGCSQPSGSYIDGGDAPSLEGLSLSCAVLDCSSVIGFNGWYYNELVFKILFIFGYAGSSLLLSGFL